MTNKKLVFHAKAFWREIKNKWAFAGFAIFAFGFLVVMGGMLQDVAPASAGKLGFYFVFFGFMAVLQFCFMAVLQFFIFKDEKNEKI